MSTLFHAIDFSCCDNGFTHMAGNRPHPLLPLHQPCIYELGNLSCKQTCEDMLKFVTLAISLATFLSDSSAA